MRLAVGARRDGQRLEADGAHRGVRHPEPERERPPRGIELADDVVDIRKTAVVQLEELLQEALRARHLFEDDAFPQRVHVDLLTLSPAHGGTERDDAISLHADAGRDDREDRRRPLVDPLEQLRMIREE